MSGALTNHWPDTHVAAVRLPWPTSVLTTIDTRNWFVLRELCAMVYIVFVASCFCGCFLCILETAFKQPSVCKG